MSSQSPRRITQLFVGMLLNGAGIALTIQAGIGIAPWDVLTQGLSIHTGLSFGQVSVITSIVILFIWIPIRQKPGIGTLANAVLIGVLIDVFMPWIPVAENLGWSVAYFGSGLLLLGVGTGLYIGARYGPGPRDGLMTGLHALTGWPIWIVRTGLETLAVGSGWLLGGDVGFGTLAFAVLIGPLVGFFMPRLHVPPAPEATVAPDASDAAMPDVPDAVVTDALDAPATATAATDTPDTASATGTPDTVPSPQIR